MLFKIAEDVYVDANSNTDTLPSPLQLVKLADKLSQAYLLQGLAELVRQRAQDMHSQDLSFQKLENLVLLQGIHKGGSKMNPYTQRLHDKIDEFLQDWLDWAEGRPHKDDHLDCVGLCSNLAGYITGLPEDMQDDISDEFRSLLKDDYPFDESELAYREDGDKRLNPKRRAWVKQRLGVEA